MSADSMSRYQRLRQRWVDRAAARMFDRLKADPGSYRKAPSTFAATALAVLILCTMVGLIALLVRATIWTVHHGAWPAWFLIGLAWAMVIVVRPRAGRLPRGAIVIDAADSPGLHALVSEVANAVGIRPPTLIAVDLNFNAYVMRLGLLRTRDALVVGLPLWSLGSWHERIGVLGHELGHLRGRDTARGRLVWSAVVVLEGVHHIVAPSSTDSGVSAGWGAYHDMANNGFAEDLTRLVQAILALPLLALSVLLERVTLRGGQHREYLADRRAADVVGSEAMAGVLLRDLEGIQTATAAAARRGEEPFAVLQARPGLTSVQREGRMAALEREPRRADDTHPPDNLRAALVLADPVPPSPSMPGEVACARAEAELVELRAAHSRRFNDELRFGRVL